MRAVVLVLICLLTLSSAKKKPKVRKPKTTTESIFKVRRERTTTPKPTPRIEEPLDFDDDVGYWVTFPPEAYIDYVAVMSPKVLYKLADEMKAGRLNFSNDHLVQDNGRWYVTNDTGPTVRIVARARGLTDYKNITYAFGKNLQWFLFKEPPKKFLDDLAALPNMTTMGRLLFDGEEFYFRDPDKHWDKIIMEGIVRDDRYLWGLTERGKERRFSNTAHVQKLKDYLAGLPKYPANFDNVHLSKNSDGAWEVHKCGNTSKIKEQGENFVNLRVADGRWIELRNIPPAAEQFLDSLPRRFAFKKANLFPDVESSVSMFQQVLQDRGTGDEPISLQADAA